jgi:hypothetical protein
MVERDRYKWGKWIWSRRHELAAFLLLAILINDRVFAIRSYKYIGPRCGAALASHLTDAQIQCISI